MANGKVTNTMHDARTFSVITPTYNRPRRLDRLMAALSRISR